jgi:hypothetical protein
VAPALLVVELVVGYAVEPGAKARDALERANAHIGLDKGFLGQVVGEHHVAGGEIEQELAQARLIGLDEFPEGAPVIDQHALGNQFQFFEFAQHCTTMAITFHC